MLKIGGEMQVTNIDNKKRVIKAYPQPHITAISINKTTKKRLLQHFSNRGLSIDRQINRLLDIAEGRRGEFIWALDIEKYNDEKSRRQD